MADEAPFEIVISKTKSLGLAVAIHNTSSKELTYCHDMFWQPTLLILRDRSGNQVHCNDQRVIMRPASPIDRYCFRELGPDGTEQLYDADFERHTEGGYKLYWGHQQFHQIAPGRYKAFVTFECQRDSWADDDRKWHHEDGIWMGVVRSNEIEIELP
jgi:hypothetical protein